MLAIESSKSVLIGGPEDIPHSQIERRLLRDLVEHGD